MSDTPPPGSDEWWPGSEDSDDVTTWLRQPAFTTQRRVAGVVEGGDYVRGSASPDVWQTALRFPTTSTFGTEELLGTGVFFARPIDYGTIELTWGTTLDLDKWGEISIVRSAFGMPMTVNNGQTIFRATQASLFPTGYTMQSAAEGIETKPTLTTRKLFDPRSMPGAPTQTELPGGRWYYYALFFRSGLKWRRYMVTSTLLPRNYHHAEHLFNNLPPYYQWTDDQMRGGAGDGDLRKFLALIGFDFDLTREYVEGWLDLYHTDFTPISLLRRLGANFGMPYESGLGDIRYRGLISKVGFLYRSRGTTRSLNEMVVSVMKCSCDVTASGNTMLLPDDSDFFEGTGSWAGISPDTPLTSFVIGAGAWSIPPSPLPPDKVRLEHGVHVVRPPDNSGRGVMRMWTSKVDATSDVFIACGNGIAQDYDLGANAFYRGDDVFEGVRMLYPRYAGIPITPLEIYNFSIQIKSDYQPVTLRLVILWFNADGDNQDLIGFSESGPGPINHLNWATHLAQGIAPATAAYAVPALWFRNRQAGSDPDYSPFIYFTAAQFSRLGTAATVSAASPDRYLTMSTEPIGPQDLERDPPFEGYLIGDPTP